MGIKIKKEFDSYLFQAVSTISLVTNLSNSNFQNSEYCANFLADDPVALFVLRESGIGNPATLQMYLYALLVAPYEVDKKHEIHLQLEELNNDINLLAFNVYSNYNYDVPKINYIKHIRNAVAHSRCNFSIENSDYCVTFIDTFGNSSCRLTMKTIDVGLILDKILNKIFKYLYTEYYQEFNK